MTRCGLQFSFLFPLNLVLPLFIAESTRKLCRSVDVTWRPFLTKRNCAVLRAMRKHHCGYFNAVGLGSSTLFGVVYSGVSPGVRPPNVARGNARAGTRKQGCDATHIPPLRRGTSGYVPQKRGRKVTSLVSCVNYCVFLQVLIVKHIASVIAITYRTRILVFF